MKKVFLFSAVCAVLSAVSCQVIEPDELNVPEGTVTRYINVAAETVTKTSLDDPGKNGTTYVVWSEGDEMAVVVSGTSTVRKATLASGAGTGKATFAIDGASAGEQYSYAIYPYDRVDSIEGSIVKVNIPTRQPFPVVEGELSSSVFAAGVNPMVGTFSGDDVQMRSLCGIFKVPVRATEGRLYAMQLQSDSRKLSGEATIDMSAGSPSLEFVDSDSAQHYIYMNATTDEVNIQLSTTPTPVYFIVPEGTFDDLKIATFAMKDARTSRLMVATKPHTFMRNVITPISSFSVIAQDTKDAISLCVNPTTGEEEFANSYIVQPSYEDVRYRVKMAFKGGDRVMLSPTGKTLFKGDSNIAFVWPIWESEEGLVKDVERYGDWIYFTVPGGVTGNVMLQAVTSKLEVQWAGHIWISDVQDQPLNNGYTFLDRNLGATYSPHSTAEVASMSDSDIIGTFGCYYQWGSPLPKPGIVSPAESFSGNGYVLHKHLQGEYGQKWKASTIDAGFNRIYNYINYFYSCGATGNWTTAGLENVGENAWWQPTKTMLDPCPPGYRVPDAAAINGNLQGGQSYDYRLTKGGNYKEINGEFIWIPFAGLRVCGSKDTSSYTGDLINYFNTDKLGNTAFYPRAHLWYCGLEEIATAKIQYGFKGVGNTTITTSDYPETTYYQFTMSGGTIDKTGAGGSNGNLYDGGKNLALFVADAASIRCVKE